jgi:hypothetical protein
MAANVLSIRCFDKETFIAGRKLIDEIATSFAPTSIDTF